MFKALFGRNSAKDHPHVLYGVVVARARSTEFYRDFGVPDTIDGRFEMMAMHVYLVLRRLKRDDVSHAAFSQALFDVFIDDISIGLREAGVGDQTVPKRLQKMSRVFYGRVKAWDADLESEDSPERLTQTLNKNLYPGEKNHKNLDRLAKYMVAEDARLNTIDTSAIIAGKNVFEGSTAGVREGTDV